MYVRFALAAVVATMLAGDAQTMTDDDMPPPYRLKIAQWLFAEGINAAEDPVKGRQSFHLAGQEYETLTAQGFDDPELFLNQGNAFFLAGDLPQAILAYRCGLRRHPLHAQLWDNLTAARDVVGYPDGSLRQRPSGDDWPAWLPRPAPALLVYTTVVLHTFGWLAASVWLILRRRLAAIATLGLVLAAGVTGGWWAILEHRITQDERQPLAVVALNGVTLRRGNGPLYPRHPELPVVNRGMEAVLLTERGGWLQLQFPGGEVGWLPQAAVLLDRSQ